MLDLYRWLCAARFSGKDLLELKHLLHIADESVQTCMSPTNIFHQL